MARGRPKKENKAVFVNLNLKLGVNDLSVFNNLKETTGKTNIQLFRMMMDSIKQ